MGNSLRMGSLKEPEKIAVYSAAIQIWIKRGQCLDLQPEDLKEKRNYAIKLTETFEEALKRALTLYKMTSIEDIASEHLD